MGKDITVILRCSEEEKSAWTTEADRKGDKFSEWARRTLSKEADSRSYEDPFSTVSAEVTKKKGGAVSSSPVVRPKYFNPYEDCADKDYPDIICSDHLPEYNPRRIS